MSKALLLALTLALLPEGALIAQSGAAARTPVPVRRVVLFSSGVGYYEHDGLVHGSGSTELRFKADQINDVLKSLVLQDRDGGRVGAVTYPSQAPLSKTLKSFQVDITNNPSLADLLNQLRGAPVTVQLPAERIVGTILGVESRRKSAAVGEPVAVPTLDLLSGGTIRAVELPSISGLSLDDPQLEEELTKALAALVQARDQETKPVTIDFSGSGDHRMRIGYVVEAPIWKTSYRLLLGDQHAQLQGWAIVENQTESDWNDVSLSLVSGRPISFIMDLYQPLYANRPTVIQQSFAGLRPPVYENGISAADSVRFDPESRSARVGQLMTPAPAAANLRLRGATQLSEVVVTGTGANEPFSMVQAAAQREELGQLFEYSVGNVTLPRRKSAMIPIIADTVRIERVAIYNASVLPRNALSGVRLTNNSGSLLLQGPITVLDKNTYAGDARIDDVPTGQSRLLAYGVDLQLTVNAASQPTNSRTGIVKIVHGVLHSETFSTVSMTYAAENKSDHEKTLIVEHPIRPGYKLVDVPKPIETTTTLYRFEGKAPPHKVTVLTVKEEMMLSSDVALTAVDYTRLIAYSRSGEIPRAVRDALGKAAEMQQRFMELDRQVMDRNQRLAQLASDQARIREDMKTVSQNTPYYQRLLSKLNDQESAIEKLQQERDDLVTRRDAQRKEFDNYVAGLDVV